MKVRRPAVGLSSVLALLGLTSPAGAGNPPTTVGEVFDGTPADVASSARHVWIAEGRNVAILDAHTGQRRGLDQGSPYPRTLAAIEYDLATGTRIVASLDTVYVYVPGSSVKIWSPPPSEHFPEIQDIKIWPGSRKVFVVAGRKLAVLDFSNGPILRLSTVQSPLASVLAFRRITVAEVDGHMMAYMVAAMDVGALPRRNGVVIADLDREHGYAQPFFYGNPWLPYVHYNDDQASSKAVVVYPDLIWTRDIAYVADGGGLLTKLDVSDPSNPLFVSQPPLGGGCVPQSVFNLVKDPASHWLYVASLDRLHTIDVDSDAPLGCSDIRFTDGGRRDMTLTASSDGTKLVWTATGYGINYVVHGIDVRNPAPVDAHDQWLASSCDGAVAVPQWHSVYLPTFGGVVRYDVSDEAHPVAVEGSYQPANGLTEHIELMWPNPADSARALLITAPGSGGVDLWRIDRLHPNPSPPVRMQALPPQWGNGHEVYQNDVAPYRKNGVNYVLADLTNLSSGEIALQAYNLSTGACVNAVANYPWFTGLANDIAVSGNNAFVACRGGILIFALDGLPASMSVVGDARVDVDGDGLAEPVGSVVVDLSGTHVYIATDGIGTVISYYFDPASHALFGPISVISGPDFTGCVGRLRYNAANQRIYLASRSASLIEIDASNPFALQELSCWRDPGYKGDLQDAQIYDFGHGPRILVVKNNESFAILDPDDGL